MLGILSTRRLCLLSGVFFFFFLLLMHGGSKKQACASRCTIGLYHYSYCTLVTNWCISSLRPLANTLVDVVINIRLSGYHC